MSRGSQLPIFILILSGIYQAASADDHLGRFFTSPEERAMLENMRLLASQPVVAPEPEPEPVVEVAVPEPEPEPAVELQMPGVTVNGVVYRKGGKSTAWLNGENTLEGDLESQYLHVDGDAIKGQQVPVHIPVQEQPIELKPGQTWQPGTGQVLDIYTRPSAPSESKDEG